MVESKSLLTISENFDKFKEWLGYFPKLASPDSVRVLAICARLFDKEVLEVTPETLRRFLKKHPRIIYVVAIKYLFEFRGYGDHRLNSFRINGTDISLPEIKAPAKKPKVVPTLEELKAALGALQIDNLEVKWATTLMFKTGCRFGDVARTTLSQLDFANNTIAFETKGGEYRVVELEDTLMKDLRDFVIEKKGLLASDKIVYTNSANIHAAYLSFQRYLNKYFPPELKRYFLITHNMRRAAINYVLKKTGGNILTASQYIKHKRLDTTKIYLDELQAAEARKRGADIMKEGTK